MSYMIKDNVSKLFDSISDYSNVSVVAAIKYANINQIKELVDNNISNLGLNRVDDFLEKHEFFKNYNIVWHFIGTLQSRKTKLCINKIDYLHSLDSINLAKEIQKYSKKIIKCFIEVNISEEETKHGLSIDMVSNFIEGISSYDKIEVIGLMTMAPNTDDVLIVRKVFNKLKNLQEDLKKQYPLIKNLSMGMSNDYLIALDCGSNYIRIGSKLFKED